MKHLPVLALLYAVPALAQPADNPVAMATGAHLKAMCSRQDDRASRIICLSWLNGASQGNGWFEPRDPARTPAFCPPSRDFDLAVYRATLLTWLDRHPADLASPSIEVYSKALAAKYPCKTR
jgi:Rap1a immunity proteins